MGRGAIQWGSLSGSLYPANRITTVVTTSVVRCLTRCSDTCLFLCQSYTLVYMGRFSFFQIDIGLYMLLIVDVDDISRLSRSALLLNSSYVLNMFKRSVISFTKHIGNMGINLLYAIFSKVFYLSFYNVFV